MQLFNLENYQFGWLRGFAEVAESVRTGDSERVGKHEGIELLLICPHAQNRLA